MQGYFATMESQAELNTIWPGTGHYNGWVGARGASPYGWYWVDGPEAGQSVFTSNFARWSGGTVYPTNTDDSGMVIGVGGGYSGFAGVGTSWVFFCEFGGTGGKESYTGALNLVIRTTQCRLDAHKYYPFPGVCHTEHMYQPFGGTVTRNLFATDVVPDLVFGNDYVKQFTLTSTIPLCTNLAVIPSGNVAVSGNTLTSLVLEGHDALNQYRTVLSTIVFTSCPRHVDYVDEYEFVWSLSPSLVGFLNPETNEYHYYQYLEENHALVDQIDLCHGTTILGLSGYLATITSNEENDFIKGTGHYVNGRVGLYNVYRNTASYQWIVGPEAGSYAKFSNWASTPTNLANRAVSMSGSGWVSQSASTAKYRLCEYGGTPSTQGSRGATRIDVRTSLCKFDSWAAWAEKGPCRLVTTKQGLLETPTHSLFPSDLLSEVTVTAGDVANLQLTVAPPLCTAFTYTLSGSVVTTTSTNTQLKLSNTEPIATYRTIMGTIKYTTCPRAYEHIDNFYVTFYLHPSGVTFTHGKTSEPHLLVTGGTDQWIPADNSAKASVHFGLQGYLPTVDHASVNTALLSEVISKSVPIFFMGLSDQVLYNAQQWSGGPAAGTFSIPGRTYTNWDSSEPSHSVFAKMEYIGALYPNDRWRDVDGMTSHLYVRQHGGMSAVSTIRGGLVLKIHSTHCRFGLGSTQDMGFKGACHHVFADQKADGTTSPRKLFTTDAVPDLISSDATNAKSFTLSATPAMCSALTVTPGALTITANTLTGMELSGVQSVATYY
eukprot:PhM_4_TR14652/c2_g3_i2/m.91077